ncbi:MAG: Gx transporter family protein [Eubacteriales bacterium]|nr:Gx transporter family protein [Eubacteriales bacterium]
MIKEISKEGKKNSSRDKIYTIAVCGVLTALAMIFSYVESLMPIPLPVPGIKLGVANIAIITVMYAAGVKEALIINIIRIALTAILFGNFNSFIFSMAGGMLSILSMILLKKTGQFSMTGVSIAGGVAHNIGQIIAAIFVMGSSTIMYYLPVLMILGVFTGAVIGIVAALVVKRVKI